MVLRYAITCVFLCSASACSTPHQPILDDPLISPIGPIDPVVKVEPITCPAGQKLQSSTLTITQPEYDPDMIIPYVTRYKCVPVELDDNLTNQQGRL